jgi:Dolichyl-phosphate-mannose-protein mannosyltransferase
MKIGIPSGPTPAMDSATNLAGVSTPWCSHRVVRALEYVFRPVNALMALIGVVLLKGIGRGEFYYWRDEMHHAMDGVFFRDFLVDLPLHHPIQYAYGYYAKYPAVSLPHWPPLFAVIQGLFFLAFGLSPWVSRLAILSFALMGVYFWYRIAERLGPGYRAFLSSVVLFCLPFILVFERVTMLEIPALATTLGAIYYWLKFLETEQRRDLCLLALFSTCALLVSQLAVLLPFLIVLDLLMERRFGLLRRWDVWIALFVSVLLVAPWYYLAFSTVSSWVVRVTGQESFGFLERGNSYLYYVRALYGQLGLLLLGLAGVGIVLALRRRSRTDRFLLTWIASGYLCFLIIGEKDTRHTIVWIPPLIYLVLIALESLLVSRKLAMIGSAVLALFYAVNAFRIERPIVGGASEVAQFVLSQPESDVVYVQGPLAADFIFYVRKFDPLKEHLVAREKQVVVSGLWFSPREVLHDQDEIVRFFQTWGIRYAVLEDRDNVPHLEAVRQLLNSDQFERVRSFPIYSNDPEYTGGHFYVYRYRGELHRTDQTVYVPMLAIPHDIPVSLSRLAGRPWPN